jgi:hypothetical protein
MNDDAVELRRIVWIERALTASLLIAIVAGMANEPRVLLGLVLAVLVTVAAGQPVIAARLHRAEPTHRARVLRRSALAITPALACALALVLLMLEGFDHAAAWPVELGGVALLAMLGTAFADLVVAQLVPTRWWAPGDRWTPRPITRGHLWVWLLATSVAFGLLTAVVRDDGCAVDGTCTRGIPFAFESHGGWSGPRPLALGMLWLDIVIFASIGPAMYGMRRSALRPIFAFYLPAVLLLLVGTAIDRAT